MDIGKTLIIFGIILIIAGAIFIVFKGNFPKLPGDIFIQKDNFTFYFPWVTMIIVSIILTIIINLFFRK